MLIITTLALLMAATMGWLALRLLREEQRRSEARVAALSTAIEEPRAAVIRQELPALPQLVTLDDGEPDEFFASASSQGNRSLGETDAPRAMFGSGYAAETSAPDDRRWLAVALAVLVVLGIVGVIWATSGSSQHQPTTAAAVAEPGAKGGLPLELISLGHERTENGLVVRGLVRNPTAGSTRTATSASIFLFDEAGSFLGSGRHALDIPTLSPGDESGFEVTLPGSAKVRRYRVTFRDVDGTVVPHLDKRNRG